MDIRGMFFKGWLEGQVIGNREVGDYRAAEICERIIEEYDSVMQTNDEDQPTTPAESLHEMAKRMCDTFTDCDNCPMDCGYSHCIVGTHAELSDAQAADQLEIMRKWAAENPPKPALTGVCALCSNVEVACGNCAHNPRLVDHFVRSEDAPKPPEDGVCESCQNDNCGEFDWPCADCVHGGGKKEYYQPKGDETKFAKTYREDFFEKFPDAPKFCDYPAACLKNVYIVCKSKEDEYFQRTTNNTRWDKPLGYWETP
jgi:hypothetical protein